MALTKTIHPPAGATALLAATEPAIVRMGWAYVGVMTLGTIVLMAVAGVVNNLGRRWPVYWWCAGVPGEERGTGVVDGDGKREGDEEKVVGMGGSEGGGRGEEGVERRGGIEEGVVVRAGIVVVPSGLHLSEEEMDVLRILEERLRETRSASVEEGRDVLDRVRSEGTETLGSASTLASRHSVSGDSFEEKRHGET